MNKLLSSVSKSALVLCLTFNFAHAMNQCDWNDEERGVVEKTNKLPKATPQQIQELRRDDMKAMIAVIQMTNELDLQTPDDWNECGLTLMRFVNDKEKLRCVNDKEKFSKPFMDDHLMEGAIKHFEVAVDLGVLEAEKNLLDVLRPFVVRLRLRAKEMDRPGDWYKLGTYLMIEASKDKECQECLYVVADLLQEAVQAFAKAMGEGGHSLAKLCFMEALFKHCHADNALRAEEDLNDINPAEHPEKCKFIHKVKL